MRLPDFILANMEPILQEWENFARSLTAGGDMGALALRNDAESILRSAVCDMAEAQTDAQQQSKSLGRGGAGGAASDGLDKVSAIHGVARFGSGFSINDVIAEYRALRASVLRLWAESNPPPDANHLLDKMRFHEAIDQSLTQVAASFTRREEQSRQIFLAILAHDLRSPLSAIKMSAQLLSGACKGDPQDSEALAIIGESADVCARLVEDLIAFAAPSLGGKMAIEPTSVDVGRLAQVVIAEFKAAHPGRAVAFDRSGDLQCTCDGRRLRQVLTNLLNNAFTHGAPDTPIELSMGANDAEVFFSVRNQGRPIPPDLLPAVFQPLVRNMDDDAETRPRREGLGLGLFIAREIVTAHGGTIDVASTAETGTVFTVRLPRQAQDDEVPGAAVSQSAATTAEAETPRCLPSRRVPLVGLAGRVALSPDLGATGLLAASAYGRYDGVKKSGDDRPYRCV